MKLKLTYSFAASLLNDIQLDSIRNKIYPEVLISKGYNRNWHKILRYSILQRDESLLV